MTGFSDIRPECRFSVLDGDSSFALERLQNGEAVFAFVGTSSRKTIFSYHTVCRDRMVLITPNNKEFAEKKEMGVLGKELLEWPMIMRESGSGTRRETDNYLKSIGMSSADLNVAGYMNNIEGIKSMVAAGKGTTILSERAAADAIRDGRVLCFDLEEDGPYRDIYIAYLKNRSFTQTEQAFLNYVRNRSGEKPKQNKNNKMANVKVNAVGDQCPIPVVKATKALGEFKEAGTLEVQVDNEIAIQNLTRLADSKGLKSRSEKLGDNLFAITMEVNGPLTMGGEDLSCHTDNRGDFVVAIDTDAMGRGSDDLGRTLMKGFIYAVSQLETLPKTILFYNGGAKLTTEGSVSLEDLRSMEAQGVQILTCGTCLNFYGLADKLAVGSVTNMYVIVETLAKAGKVIKP